MKKITLTLVAAMAILFASCGNKTTEKTEDSDATIEVITETVVESGSQSVVDQYAVLLEEYIPLAEKVKTGDVAAAQDMAKLAEKINALITDNEEAFVNMSEADVKKYQELAEKFAKAMQ